MNRPEVSAVVVTRGDVDLSEIADSLAGFDELVIWNNALEIDRAVYGRYEGVRQARNGVVFVQDDDCIVHGIDELLDAYVAGEIVANMPVSRWDDYPDSCLVGWGAVFDRDLPDRAIARFHSALAATPGNAHFTEEGRERFFRTCDVVFSTLTPHRKVDLGFSHLPWAEDPARAMFKKPGHKEERDGVLQVARGVRDGASR